ncbi:hypothetical protein PAGU2638_11750 [Lysobacter sp. PAGU 2638]
MKSGRPDTIDTAGGAVDGTGSAAPGCGCWAVQAAGSASAMAPTRASVWSGRFIESASATVGRAGVAGLESGMEIRA